ncbi:glucose dehydrogenase [FAD, quinone]-like isoform X1 [Balamuthia mandrillaris]
MSSFSLLCLLSLCCLSFALSFATAQIDTFDYVVIGAGTAGCAVAGRLAEADAEASILLLERGHFPSEEQWDSVDQNSHLLAFNLWESSNYSRKWPSEPNPGLGNASVEMFYADSVGGATMINTGQYSRPHASYFNAWNLPNWEWDKVSPFYLQMENHKPSSNSSSASFFGTGGPLPISMSFEQTHGKDFIAAIKYHNETFLDGQEALEEDSEAFLQAPRIILNGKRVTSYQAYVEPLLQDAEANIELRTRVAVDKIILKEKQTEASEESGESKWIAVGVVYRDEEGREREVRVRREVIVSAGVYDSPIVLMRSGIGPEEHLSSIGIDTLIDLPAVGQNLKNRGGYTVTSVLTEPTPEMTIDPENETVIAQWESNPDSSPLSASLAEILGFGKSSSESPDIDMMYEMTNVIPRSIGVHVDTLVCILAKVRSTGHVELRSEDPWDNAKVWPNFLGDEGDWEALLSCIDFMRTLNTAPSMTASEYSFSSFASFLYIPLILF